MPAGRMVTFDTGSAFGDSAATSACPDSCTATDRFSSGSRTLVPSRAPSRIRSRAASRSAAVIVVRLSLIAWIAASLIRLARSAPEKPGVPRAVTVRSTSGASFFPRACTARIAARSLWLGSGTTTCRSKRPGRSSAGSSDSGRLVAAITTTPGAWSKPSISDSSWFSVCSRSSLPPPMTALPRRPPMASISSMKMIEGARLRASANRSRTRDAPTPTNSSTNADPVTDRNGTCASPATARAMSVLPVPGGPTMSTPRGPCAPAAAYRIGSRRKSTTSLISCLTPSYPATSENRVVGRSASMTLARDRPNPPMPDSCRCAARPVHTNRPTMRISQIRLGNRVSSRPPPAWVAVIWTWLAFSCWVIWDRSSAVGSWLVNSVPLSSFPVTAPLLSIVTDFTSPLVTLFWKALNVYLVVGLLRSRNGQNSSSTRMIIPIGSSHRRHAGGGGGGGCDGSLGGPGSTERDRCVCFSRIRVIIAFALLAARRQPGVHNTLNGGYQSVMPRRGPATVRCQRNRPAVPARRRRSAGAGLPAEESHRQHQPGHAPGGDHQDVGPVEGGAEEAGLHPVGEVLDREDPGDPEDPVRGVVAERDEDPGQEQQRQDDRVDDRGRGVGVRDHRRGREPERAERRRADHEHDQEPQQREPGRDVGGVERAAERGGDHDQDHRDEQRVHHPRAEERPAGQRRPVDALEHPGVALEGGPYRDVVVAGGDHREGRHRGHVVGGRVHRPGADVHRVVAEQRGEDHQEHERESEGEERRRRVPPERLVDVTDLRGSHRHRAHAVPPSRPLVSDR